MAPLAIDFLETMLAIEDSSSGGMKVDQKGNLYVSGPGGLWIISAEGKHLGDEDGKTLYFCAQTDLAR